jgi:hypothetical protein
VTRRTVNKIRHETGCITERSGMSSRAEFRDLSGVANPPPYGTTVSNQLFKRCGSFQSLYQAHKTCSGAQTNSQTNSQTSGHTRRLTYCQTTHRAQCHKKLLNNDGFKIPPAKLNLNSPRTEFVTIYSLEIFVSRYNDSTRDRPGWEMTV